VLVKETVGEALVKRLIAWGVDTVFGLPGDGINGIMEGFRRHAEEIRFLLVHHEEAAAFMACGYAKATGRLGVCLSTSGPGGIHLLNGLYDAKLDYTPVLAITGSQETAVMGTAYQQEVDLTKPFADVALAYNLLVSNPAQLPAAVDLAVRNALAKKGVAHISVPNDIQIAEVDSPYASPSPGEPAVTLPVYHPAPTAPRTEDLLRAADVLNAGSKVAILAGAGALHARAEVLALADALAAPIVKTLPGKAVVPDDSEFTTGGLGLLGTGPSEDVMDGCDTLLLLGTNYPYTKYLPTERGVRTVQIDLDGGRIGSRMPTEAPVVGDVRDGATALLGMVNRKDDRAFLQDAQKAMGKWREDMAALQSPERSPIAPQYLMSVVDELAGDDAILTCDSGTIATWAARHWTIRGSREFYLSGNLATMAPGLPYAIAMQHAFPSRQVIGFVGDGGFAMLMAEMLTATRNGLPIKMVINNNNSLGQILWEQIILGDPEFAVRYPAPEPDYSAWARTCGAHGEKVTQPGRLHDAVREFLAVDGPALLDVSVNPNEPPMPGKIQYEQAKHFTEAFLRGQPNKVATLATVARDKIQQFRS
jgi:thiamine pyrophosphate-dependent acetolactate synthase large subunit-like protein